MSISLKVYNKIGYEDVRRGMTLRIVTDGPGIKSDVEGIVSIVSPARRWGDGPSFATDGLLRVAFRNDSATSHVIKYPECMESATVELYEVIDAIPEEPKGVGAVVRVVNLTHPDENLWAVKTGPENSGAWIRNGVGMSWESLTECVLLQGYDYIKVLRRGVEL